MDDSPKHQAQHGWSSTVQDEPYILLHMLFRRLLFLCGFLICILPAQAQTTIAGRITNLDGGGPLPDVHVALCSEHAMMSSHRHETTTDAQGRFVLNEVPPGTWCMRAVYLIQDAAYTLTSPPLQVGSAPLVLHFAMPTALQERLQNEMDPADPSPKSLSTITGLLPEGTVSDARGVVLPGSAGRLERFLKAGLRGRVTRGGRPVPDLLVLLGGLDYRTRTDADGRFSFKNLEPGTYPVYLIQLADTLAIPAAPIRRGPNEINFSLDGQAAQ
jgi:hypothetical protein